MSTVGLSKNFAGGRSRYSSISTSPNALYVAASDSTNSVKQAADYVCDGAADQVQINKAISALPTLGGVVHLASGNYLISDDILILRSSVTLVGNGDATVIKLADASNRCMIANQDKGTSANTIVAREALPGFNITGVVIRDLKLNQNATNQVAATTLSYYGSAWIGGGIGAISLYGCDDAIIENCTIINATFSGIEYQEADGGRISQNTVTNFYDDGIALNESVTNSIVIGNVIDKGSGAVFSGSCGIEVQDGCSKISVISNCVTQANDTSEDHYGILVSCHASSPVCSFVNIFGNTVTNGERLIAVDGNVTGSSLPTNISIIGNVAITTSTVADGALYLNQCSNITIASNVFSVPAGSPSACVQLVDDISGVMINSNTFTGGGGSNSIAFRTIAATTLNNIIIEGNYFDGFNYNMLQLSGDNTNIIIRGNYINAGDVSVNLVLHAGSAKTQSGCVVEGNKDVGSSAISVWVANSNGNNEELVAGWSSSDNAFWNKRTLVTGTINLETSENNKTFLIDASSGVVTVNLPAATLGLKFMFSVTDGTNDLILNPDGSEYAYLPDGTLTSVAGEYITNGTANAAFDAITVECTQVGRWITYASIGTWTEEVE